MSASLPIWTVEGRAAALKRKARKQVEGAAPAERDRGAGGAAFNIWYGKFNTMRENREAERAGAKVLREERCNSYVDSGHTRANERGGVFFCQYFARGVCSNGGECTYFHLVPSAEDCAKHDKNPTTDIFGRDRFAEEKSNQGGVGSFFSMSRTLYVGYGAASEKLGDKLQEVFERVFSEWGPLEDVYIVRGKSIAFVRYVFRASAEMAKETMNNQSLQPAWWPGAPSAPEVLNVRWAYDDPNPVAIRRNKREREEAFADAAQRAEERLPPDQREALRMQRALENGLADAAPGATSLQYPSTDGQFEGEDAREAAWDAWAEAALEAGFTPQQVKAYFEAHSRSQAPPPPPPPPPAATRVLAADCYEYDADDATYAEPEAGKAGEGTAGAEAAPAGGGALAALGAYGSEDDE